MQTRKGNNLVWFQYIYFVALEMFLFVKPKNKSTVHNIKMIFICSDWVMLFIDINDFLKREKKD